MRYVAVLNDCPYWLVVWPICLNFMLIDKIIKSHTFLLHQSYFKIPYLGQNGVRDVMMCSIR